MPDFTELRLLAPELVLSCGFLLLMVLGLFRSLSLNWLLTCASLVVVADAVAVILIAPGFSKSDGGRMLMDGVFMSFNFGRLILSVAAMGTLLMVRSASLLRHRGEFFALLLGLLLGGQLLIISSHAVMILLAIELMSLSSYVLAGYLFQREGVSASVTYFIYGSIATAVMCFGFALMYSSGGVLQTDAIADTIRFGHIPDSRWLAGLLMVLAAVMFKLAAAPQHLWAPDVYAAAPTPVLAAFSTIPKVAAMLFLARLLLPPQAGITGWWPVAAVLACATLFAGNFPALMQSNIRRIMAYSSIAQSGFLLLALPGSQPVPLILFYSLALVLANLLVFVCLDRAEKSGLAENVEDLNGFSKRDPLAAAGMTIGLLSLTGLPPFAGFTAKLKLFTHFWQSTQLTGDGLMIGAFVFGLLNTVVALFYYLRIPYQMYLRELNSETEGTSPIAWNGWLIIVLSAALIWLFVAPPF